MKDIILFIIFILGFILSYPLFHNSLLTIHDDDNRLKYFFRLSAKQTLLTTIIIYPGVHKK